jgi:hypothetical protein
MEGAMTTIYDKLDSIETGKPFSASTYDGMLYLSAFVTNFSAFLKSQWNVELVLLSVDDGQPYIATGSADKTVKVCARNKDDMSMNIY